VAALVVVLIGDGSLQYSVQSLAAAAQHKLKMVYIVPCKWRVCDFEGVRGAGEDTNVPALDLLP